MIPTKLCSADMDTEWLRCREVSLLAKLAPIDGLLVMTSTVGSGAIEAFRDQGITVPENISVIVFDDDEIMNTSLPHLTSVQLSLRKMGIEAIRSLNKILAGEPCDNTVIDVSLKVGDSTMKKSVSPN